MCSVSIQLYLQTDGQEAWLDNGDERSLRKKTECTAEALWSSLGDANKHCIVLLRLRIAEFC